MLSKHFLFQLRQVNICLLLANVSYERARQPSECCPLVCSTTCPPLNEAVFGGFGVFTFWETTVAFEIIILFPPPKKICRSQLSVGAHIPEDVTTSLRKKNSSACF
jgi:hypothetical protein